MELAMLGRHVSIQNAFWNVISLSKEAKIWPRWMQLKSPHCSLTLFKAELYCHYVCMLNCFHTDLSKGKKLRNAALIRLQKVIHEPIFQNHSRNNLYRQSSAGHRITEDIIDRIHRFHTKLSTLFSSQGLARYVNLSLKCGSEALQ